MPTFYVALHINNWSSGPILITGKGRTLTWLYCSGRVIKTEGIRQGVVGLSKILKKGKARQKNGKAENTGSDQRGTHRLLSGAGAKKAEAEAVLKKLLASGMSADEILEKLK